MNTEQKKITVYYDEGCPFCSRYVQYLNFKKSHANTELVDVRTNADSFKKLKSLGFEIDTGMVVEVDGQYYAGGDAIHVMSLLSTPSGFFNTLNRSVFSSKLLSRFLYPALKFCRNTVISILHRSSIEDVYNPENKDKEAIDAFAIFAFAWGIYALFNSFFMMSYFELQPERESILAYLVMLFATLLVLSPRSSQLFCLLITAQFLNTGYEMPVGSNHYIMQVFFISGSFLFGVYALLTRKSFVDYFDAIAPLGRSILIAMYFFGIFHKINTDFINPEVSCAVSLWKLFPLPFGLQEATFTHYGAIYGTYIVEGFVMFTLITQRLIFPGIIIGILFHWAIGFNSFASYSSFSSIAFALHTLFLPRDTWKNFMLGPYGQAFSRNRKLIQTSLLSLLALFIGIQYLQYVTNNYEFYLIPWTIYSFPFVAFMFLTACSKASGNSSYRRFYFFPNKVILAVCAAGFILNGFAPYLGLKTRQSITMFANLRIEGGQSNHLIFRNPPGPFKYLEDLVEVIDASNFDMDGAKGYTFVYYEFLSLIDNTGITQGTVTFRRNGVLYENVPYQTLKADMDKILHPRWVREYIHFLPVDTRIPKPCSKYY